MKIKIGICSESDIQEIINVYRKIDNKHVEIEVVLYKNTKDMIEGYSIGGYQVVFIDVKEDSLSCIEITKYLNNQKEKVYVIWIGSNIRHLEEGYKYGVFDCRIKGIEIEDCTELIDRVILKIRDNEKELHKIKLKNGESIRVLKKDIVYLESKGHDINILLRDGRNFVFIGQLQKELIRLADDRFIRVHQSYVISRDYVEKLIKNSVQLKGGVVIPISKKYRDIKKEV